MATTAADIIRAESMIASSWPALNICLSGRWLLGMADGVSGRANSLFFLDHTDDADYQRRIDWMETTYRHAGLPPRARLSPLAPVAVIKELQNRGYKFQNPTLTLKHQLTDLAAISAPTMADFNITTSPAPTQKWLDTFIKGNPRYQNSRPMIEKMLDAIMDKTTYALGLYKGTPVTTAMTVEHIGTLTIQNVATQPDYTRRGFAKATMAVLMAKAADESANWCWLAVEQSNEPAINLYRNLGFQDFYSYIYASLET